MPQRISITAPSGRDAEVISRLLDEAGLESCIETTVESLIDAIEQARAGTIILAEEALRGGALELLGDCLTHQPPWSDIPIVLLTLPQSTSSMATEVTEKLGNVTVLERPFRPLVLVTAARAALRERARQHDAADYIDRIEAQAAELRVSKDELEALNGELETRIADAVAERRVLADIVEGTDSFVQVADMDFRWLAANRAATDEFERIFGCRPKVGESMLDTLAHMPEHRDAVKEVWSRALSGEEFLEQGEFGDQGRERRFYEMKFNALRDASGRQIGAYQFVTDVTDRVARERQLAEANEKMRQMAKIETLGQLTGGVAHDFNNLLTPIVGGLDILQRMHADDPRSHRIISGAIEAADRATTLVQRLLAFARQQTLQTRIVELGSLISGLQDLLRRTLGPEIHVELDLGDGQHLALIDPGQLELAVLNLAVNARDAMDGKGVIGIELRQADLAMVNDLNLPAGSYICLGVRDSGGGMDPALLEKAIEPFFTTKDVGQGTGLGLSMVHGLAAQFGGALKLNNSLGTGMTAEIWLPQAVGQPSERNAQHEFDRAGDLPQLRILLVDDDVLSREAIEALLDELGQSVVSATSAAEALRLFGEARFDVVVADVLMPDMRGDELAARLRHEQPDVPILLLTGHPGELAEHARNLPLLQKPVRKDCLAAALADLAPPGNVLKFASRS